MPLIRDNASYVRRDEWLQNGIVDRTESTLAFNDGTRVFTINPTGSSFEYYVQGILYKVTTSDVSGVNTVTLTDTEGLWAIYYDGSTLTALNSPTDLQFEDLILTKCLVGLVYYDATNNLGILYDERHGYQMPPWTHVYLHESIRTTYADGLGLGNFVIGDGSLNSHAQFSIASGECFDEDLKINLNAINSTTGNNIYYRSGSNWRWTTQTGFKCMTYDGTSATRLAWDNAGTLTEVGDNKLVLIHIFATNSYDGNPITIIGQNEYANALEARNGADIEIKNLVLGALPTKEMKPIATIIFQTRDAYTNDVNAKIVQTTAGDNYVDWRTTPLAAGVSAGDHGSLGGLGDDDHTQYLLADGTRALAGAWDLGNYALTNVNIDSGAIDGVTLGTNSPITEAKIDNININGDTISSSSDINLLPTGQVNTTKLAIGNLTDLTNLLFRVNSASDWNEALDQEFASKDATSAQTTPWQSFTSGGDGYLSAVSVHNGSGGTITGVTVRVYEGEGVDGTKIAEETGISCANNTFTRVSLSALPLVSSGSIYTIQVVSTGDQFYWNINTGGGYAGGTFIVAGQDALFRTYLADGFNFVFDSTNNRIGIGTLTPSSILDIRNNLVTEINLTGGGLGSYINAIRMNTVDSRGSGLFIDQGTPEWFVGTNYNGGSAGYFQIGYDASGGQAEYIAKGKFTIQTNGRVYIPGIYNQEMTLQIANGADVSATSDGYMVLGLINALNIAIDNNEIEARNNGSAATPLYLQNDAGILYCKAVYSNTTTASANVNVSATGLLSRSTCGEIYKNIIGDIETEITEGIFDLVIKKFTFKNDQNNIEHYSVIANEQSFNALPQAVIKTWAIVHIPTNAVFRPINSPDNFELREVNGNSELWGYIKNRNDIMHKLEDLPHPISEFEFREIYDSLNWNFINTALICEVKKLKERIEILENI